MVGIDSYLCLGVIGMSDQTSTGLRQQVRSRYAAAARAVLEPRPGVTAESVELSGTGSCCDGSATESCCGAGAAAEEVGGFSEGLYREGETEGLPEEAALASLGCGNPIAVADLHEGERVLDLGSGGGIDVQLSAKRVGPTGRAFGLDMPAESIDVLISNCVGNLAANKPAVFREIARVLRPGGRVGITDIVADDDLTTEQRAERGSYVGCIAGAL